MNKPPAGTAVVRRDPDEERRRTKQGPVRERAPRPAGRASGGGLPSFSLAVGRGPTALDDRPDAAPVTAEPAATPGPIAPDALAGAASRPVIQRASLVEVAAQATGLTGRDAAADRAGGLVVDDEARTLTPGQMRKTAFLDELRRVACEAADRELRRVGRTADGCPYLDQILARYAHRPAAALERSIRRYAPEARGATRALEYLGPVATRLGHGVAAWTTTGRLPDGLSPDLLAGGVLAGGLAGGPATSAPGATQEPTAPGAPQRKTADGHAGQSGVDAAALTDRLGPGRPLDAGARGRMESAFGQSFEHVRVHADDQAAALSRELDARAFTLGAHVAFGAGELRPGTPHGDALLAHELAHVVQQGGNRSAPSTGSAASAPHEQDADAAAAAVVGSLWGRSDGRRRSRPWPRLRGTPELQRCGRSGPSERDLQAYLLVLDAGAIEAGPSSHERARAIASRWGRGGSPYVLTADRKTMLLRELMHGVVSDDDRGAMLELLERSYNFELSVMFAGSMREDLDRAFTAGSPRIRLLDFFRRRFGDGAEAAVPRGHPVPLGEELPPGEEDTPMHDGDRRWNIPCLLGILCQQDRTVIERLHDTMTVQSATRIVADEWTFTGGAWRETHRDNILGINRRAEHLVVIRSDRTCAQAANTLFHEVHHEGQDPAVPWETREIEAYTVTAEWDIRRGIPGSFITTDPVTRARIPDAPAIAEHVRGYPGMATPGERVIGKTADGRTRMRRNDGTEFVRDPVEGDRFKVRTRPEGARTIDRDAWVCQ